MRRAKLDTWFHLQMEVLKKNAKATSLRQDQQVCTAGGLHSTTALNAEGMTINNHRNMLP